MKLPAPPMMLAHSHDAETDPTGWLMSEKLDGVRAWWDGAGNLISRNGTRFATPKWIVDGLPRGLILDGELWAWRGRFDIASGTVRKHTPCESEWRALTYVIFDAPRLIGGFEARLAGITGLPAFACVLPNVVCRGLDHLTSATAKIVSDGGEGMMIRRSGSRYAEGRSHDLLKIKPSHDAEAVVIGHEAGEGKHAGRLGALVLEMENGKRFKVGTGFTDAERFDPPALGQLITYTYTELTPAGIPRFPRFLRRRIEV